VCDWSIWGIHPNKHPQSRYAFLSELKISSQTGWWYMPMVPAIQEAEAGRLLKDRSLGPAWVAQQDLVSKKKKNKYINVSPPSSCTVQSLDDAPSFFCHSVLSLSKQRGNLYPICLNKKKKLTSSFPTNRLLL
jgi:hypothetical protein